MRCLRDRALDIGAYEDASNRGARLRLRPFVGMGRSLGDEDYCYLTTTGRVSGEPREIEIWFALEDETLYMLSGGRDDSNWVKNLISEPRVRVRIADQAWNGRARVVEGPDAQARARDLLIAKYAARYRGDLSQWRNRALPIAVDLENA
jgi:deazaflavin-dependent oxidoreductase (nitroreductase family)